MYLLTSACTAASVTSTGGVLESRTTPPFDKELARGVELRADDDRSRRSAHRLLPQPGRSVEAPSRRPLKAMRAVPAGGAGSRGGDDRSPRLRHGAAAALGHAHPTDDLCARLRGAHRHALMGPVVARCSPIQDGTPAPVIERYGGERHDGDGSA